MAAMQPRSRRHQTVHLDEETRALFELRILQDAWAEAETAYWERRARQLESAAPRVGDFTGAATPTELRARGQRLHQAADACRNRQYVCNVDLAATLQDLGDIA